MDAEEPKSPSRWRTFVWEIGIVVIGVLIALAAGQAVDGLNWRRQLAETRIGLRDQLEAGAYSAYERLVIVRCQRERLDYLRGRLVATGPIWRAEPLANDNWLWRGSDVAYRTPVRRWSTSAWQAAVASTAASRMTPKEMTRFATANELLELARRANQSEELYVADLSALAIGGPMSEATRERMLTTVDRARNANGYLRGTSTTILRNFKDLGVRVSESEQREILADMKATYGPCAAPAVYP